MGLFSQIQSFFGIKSPGQHLLDVSRKDDKLATYLRKIRNEGASDSDIKMWWDLPKSEHQRLIKEDDTFKMTAIISFIDQGLTQDEAHRKVRLSYPIYGDPTLWTVNFDDRPLPYELKNRINRYFSPENQMALQKAKSDIDKFTSMNAYIRQLIRSKVI